MSRIITANDIQANADLLCIDYMTAYSIHVEDAAGFTIPRVREVDLDTGDCVVGLHYDYTPRGIEVIHTRLKLNYFKLVSGTWYLEYKAKDIVQ